MGKIFTKNNIIPPNKKTDRGHHGTYKVIIMKSRNIKHQTVEIECPVCKGSGYTFRNDINIHHEQIVKRRRCKKCNGKGYVVRSIAYTQKDFRM